MDVNGIRKFVKVPKTVWGNIKNGLRITVCNYGHPEKHQEHKLRLIIRFERHESGARYQQLSWVDCTYTGEGVITDLDNWVTNMKAEYIKTQANKILLMEFGVRNLLSVFEKGN